MGIEFARGRSFGKLGVIPFVEEHIRNRVVKNDSTFRNALAQKTMDNANDGTQQGRLREFFYCATRPHALHEILGSYACIILGFVPGFG